MVLLIVLVAAVVLAWLTGHLADTRDADYGMGPVIRPHRHPDGFDADHRGTNPTDS